MLLEAAERVWLQHVQGLKPPSLATHYTALQAACLCHDCVFGPEMGSSTVLARAGPAPLEDRHL